MRIVVPPHPLIGHWLTMLRHMQTPPALYATAMQEIGRWLTYEAIRDWLPNRNESIEVKEGKIDGIVIDGNIPLLTIPVFPEGIELWQGARGVLPGASLCVDHIPNVIEKNSGLIIFLAQICSGKKLHQILSTLINQGVESKRIRIITAVASKPGLIFIGEKIKELTIHTACIDPNIDSDGNISPGIGEPIKRLNLRSILR